MAAVTSMLAVAAQAHAAPLIDSTVLGGGAVTGRTVELRVRASDPQAPVSGMVVGFGSGETGYGLSNCLPPDSRGRPFGGPAAPGARVTLAAPHIYRRPGARTLLANVTSSGCTGRQASTVQAVQVQVVRPGTAPRPIVTLPPVNVPVGQVLPELPGLGQLPSGSLDLGVPGVPAVPIPTVPALPLPALPALPGLPGATQSAGCPGRHRWYSRRRAAERAAKAALLCLLNAERRRRGLRPMRANARLSRAARSHSRSMVRRRFFGHMGPGARSTTARLRSVRYLAGRKSWVVGENIGFGNGSLTRPASIHRAWMRSTPHRAAMLSRRFREVGFGLYPGTPFGRRGATFTADFAAAR